ncbi:hypothetical protein Acr_18g0008700 [Actinidia rufa]|uniref:Uncharacterized protein n=1 Tax=Actinidia rufa TaxID=165716 RepID=A0A7J0G7D4_9ERIC|nr:hypothetical protein Acr_18g0008700 [Actinidia rufa]
MVKGRGEPNGTTSTVKGVVIGEKHSRDKMPKISPSKTGKQAIDAKEKGPTTKASSKSRETSSQAMTKEVPTSVDLGEGTLANPGHTAEKLKRMKEDHDVALERLEKEMAELREKEVLAKKSPVEEYKSSNDFQEAIEKAASTYFDLCKKEIGLIHPNLNIQDLQIDHELIEEDEDEEKDELDNSHPP